MGWGKWPKVVSASFAPAAMTECTRNALWNHATGSRINTHAMMVIPWFLPAGKVTMLRARALVVKLISCTDSEYASNSSRLLA